MPSAKWIGCAPNNFRMNRPPHLEIEAIVIHLIDGSLAGADATFLDNNLDVPRSAHYGIGKDGTLHQYVLEKDTAFHAGVVRNPSRELKKSASGATINPNYYTIGIEHEGRPNDLWTNEMYAASAALVADISARYPKLAALSAGNVMMHREIRGDKSCPGNKFDLARLLNEATGGSPAPAPGAPAPTPQVVITTSAVNLRRGSPSPSAVLVRLIPAGTMLHVLETVQGDAFKGNSTWYRTLDGDYFWSGAV